MVLNFAILLRKRYPYFLPRQIQTAKINEKAYSMFVFMTIINVEGAWVRLGFLRNRWPPLDLRVTSGLGNIYIVWMHVTGSGKRERRKREKACMYNRFYVTVDLHSTSGWPPVSITIYIYILYVWDVCYRKQKQGTQKEGENMHIKIIQESIQYHTRAANSSKK